MAATTELMTVANLAKELGIPKAKLDRRLKEEKVEPDLVKARCAYYSLPRIKQMRPTLGV